MQFRFWNNDRRVRDEPLSWAIREELTLLVEPDRTELENLQAQVAKLTAIVGTIADCQPLEVQRTVVRDLFFWDAV